MRRIGAPYRLSRAIVAHDERKRGMKLDGLAACIVEGSDPGGALMSRDLLHLIQGYMEAELPQD